ncbi:DsbA family protein [Salisaeta longa]|uniref:DsbA family protein n=1 Tax=Salisaeta longa TaxID=503170 RepID=UPI00041C26BC|nr:thioredoxin domain-containing protein [Salisaeta longa]
MTRRLLVACLMLAFSVSIARGQACTYDTTRAPVENPSSLVNFQDAIFGDTNAAVTVIEYFDPNCPHCKTMHAVMKPVMKNQKDEVRFVFKPFPLRRSSLPEIEALYAAAQQDKFIPMLEALYARQSPSGLGTRDIRAAAEAVGIAPDALMSRVQDGSFRPMVLEARKKAIQIGVNSTPTVLINGKFVAGSARTRACMNTLINQAQAQASK